jgi:hypothetical protein
MKTNRIQWASGRGGVRINGTTDSQLSHCDGTIKKILDSRRVEIKNDWDAAFTAEAMVDAEDIVAIRTAVAALSAQTIPVRTCKKCGNTNLRGAMFTTLAGQSICDDCV